MKTSTTDGSAARSRASRVLVALVRGYQLGLSPWLGGRCRHLPSCSAYAIEALGRFGAVSGGWLALKRLGRCHPWGTSGYDPVPERPVFRERAETRGGSA
ncbi:MAG TPA: membrane protein insertion efficiency factor YidD [Gammaproteobacteria bacterium]|nr:membrane protein insertion efficiency factor YidD [Gammaproteobacteria bacterium]